MTDWTTLLEWIGTRWPPSAPVPQRARIFPVEQSTPHVPGEYRALYTYLEHRCAFVVVLTFEQKSEPGAQRGEDGRMREDAPACILAAGRGVPQLPDAIGVLVRRSSRVQQQRS